MSYLCGDTALGIPDITHTDDDSILTPETVLSLDDLMEDVYQLDRAELDHLHELHLYQSIYLSRLGNGSIIRRIY